MFKKSQMVEMLKTQLQASTAAEYMGAEEFFDTYFNMYNDSKFKGKIIRRMFKIPTHMAYISDKYPELVIKYI